jgi:predicted permease
MRLIRWFYTVPLRLRSLFRRKQVEQELDEELRYHLERQIEEQIAKGMTPEEARYAALRALGGVERRKEECRDMRRVRLIEELMQDLRYGLRMLRKSPGFMAVAVLSLALGIGANTAIFSVFDPIVIKSLPVKDPEQLVVIKTVDDRGKEDGLVYSFFKQLRPRTQVFSGIFAEGGSGIVPMDTAGPEPWNQTERARLNLVSGEYFEVLGVNAVLGRTLTTADNQTPGAHPVAVLSYRFWQRRFAGDVSVVGKVIKLKKQPFTIIGITPPEFFGARFGGTPDIWVPLVMMKVLYPGGSGLSDMDDWGLSIMARLRSGVSEEQAQAALDIFLAQIKSEGTRRSSISKIKLFPGRQGFAWFRDWISQPLRILMAVVGLVLLIACANVANLLLARAARRAQEVAIRLTIGAGRFRLIRQFLTESALLAAAGAVLGLLFAWWGHRIILALISEYDSSITIDSIGSISNARVLGFTVAASLLTTFLFGFAPALIATRQDPNAALKTPAPPRLPRSRLSLSRSLVIAQVAMSLLLLTGAGLIVQTLRNLRTMDFGFAAEQIIQAPIFARDAGYKEDQLPGLYSQVLERLNSAPGVRAATMASTGFLFYSNGLCCIDVEGYTLRPDEDRRIHYENVRPGYFQVVGQPLLLGRDFTQQDISNERRDFADGGEPEVAIINETMARYYFGTANPLGKRLGFSDTKYPTTIVGVVKDSVYNTLRNKIRAIYIPSQTGKLLVVRAAGPAAPLVATIRREIQAVDKNLVIGEMYTFPQLLDQDLFVERLLAKLSSFFAMLALLLACIGLYGVMSYDVARRTHEIGIRMALGAQKRDVVRLVMRETMLLVAIGVIIGLGASLATTRLIASLLYGLTPNDPLTIALAGLLLLMVAALAGYLPARRAARVDPMVALRHE